MDQTICDSNLWNFEYNIGEMVGVRLEYSNTFNSLI